MGKGRPSNPGNLSQGCFVMFYPLLGFSLGLSAGLAPGPLLALVIQRTLRYGAISGLRIALAPLITDFPIVILALLVIAHLPKVALHGLMAAGGLFVLWLAWEAWHETGADLTAGAESPSAQQDFLRGAMVNFLNPHPYLFWGAVGAPILFQAWDLSPWQAVGFIFAFYLMLVGGKVALALVLGRFRQMPPHIYHRATQFSALLLLASGAWMLYTAWQGIASAL
ncbi:MAG TPA: LysE family translocator [Caldilineales bacterium]|nr:LysE family translocator [Caldilineales bacterium]